MSHYRSYYMNVSVWREYDGQTASESLSGYSSIYYDQLYGQGDVVCAEASTARPNEHASWAGNVCF